MSEKIAFANAHPNAQRIMQDDFYYSVIDGFAPFGDDDSWETFMALKEWIVNDPNKSKIQFIEDQLNYFAYPRFDLRSQEYDRIKAYIEAYDLGLRYLIGTDQVIMATAFGQLYLQGFIDLNVRALTRTAIQRQSIKEILDKYDDLRSRREESLSKLLSVVSPNN